MDYLTTHSTHFIYGNMASDIWLRTILIVRKEIRCCHIGYSLRLTARVLLYAPSHRQHSTYHGLCYTSRGALAVLLLLLLLLLVVLLVVVVVEAAAAVVSTGAARVVVRGKRMMMRRRDRYSGSTRRSKEKKQKKEATT